MEALVEAFVLELKGLKDTIEQNKQTIEENKETIEQNRGEIQALKDLNSKQDAEIALTKQENLQLKNKIAQMKEENVALQKQMGTLQREETDKRADENTNDPSLPLSGDSITMLNKKVRKLDNKFTTRITTLQEALSKLEKRSTTVLQLQRVLNTMHLSLQERKDLQEQVKELRDEIAEINTLLGGFSRQSGATSCSEARQKEELRPPVLQLPLQPSSKHPSKRAAVSSSQAKDRLKMQQDLIKRSTFEVSADSVATLKDETVWIENYTKVHAPCDFMDAKSGIYSVPVQGKYQFSVWRDKAIIIHTNLYLCRDRSEKQERISYYDNDRYKGFFMWQCEVNDKVWVEAVASVNNHFIKNLRFQGQLML